MPLQSKGKTGCEVRQVVTSFKLDKFTAGICYNIAPSESFAVTVRQFVASETYGFLRITRQQVARKLKAAGALPLGRVSLGKPPLGITEPYRHDAKQMQLFAMPGDLAALELRNDTNAFREAFWADWEAGLGTEND